MCGASKVWALFSQFKTVYVYYSSDTDLWSGTAGSKTGKVEPCSEPRRSDPRARAPARSADLRTELGAEHLGFPGRRSCPPSLPSSPRFRDYISQRPSRGGWRRATPSHLDYISHGALRPRPRFPQPVWAAPPPSDSNSRRRPRRGGAARGRERRAGGPGLARPPPPWACRGGRLRDAAAGRGAASAAAAVRRGPRPRPPASGGEQGPGGASRRARGDLPGGPEPSSPRRLPPLSPGTALKLGASGTPAADLCLRLRRPWSFTFFGP